MNKGICGMREEQIIDYINNNLSEEKMRAVRWHLDHCPDCRELYRDWHDLLQNERFVPSPRLKIRLKRHVAKKKYIGTLLLPSFAVWTAGLVFSLLLFLFIMPNGQQANEQLKGQTANPPMIMDPKTVQYPITPVASNEAQGYAWINDESNEMLLLVKGLSPMEEKDYQVWLIAANERSNLGLLHLDEGMAHFYYRGEQMKQGENIAVSIEPKGGSRNPTGPDAIWVELKK